MAHKITDECINCGACETECPSNAISESDEKRIISQDACTHFCNCVTICPVEAILAP